MSDKQNSSRSKINADNEEALGVKRGKLGSINVGGCRRNKPEAISLIAEQINRGPQIDPLLASIQIRRPNIESKNCKKPLQ